MKYLLHAWKLPLAKLRILSGTEVCKILANHEFVQVRQKGSHIIMQRKTDSTTITVPVPNHKEIKLGTLQSIRQSGLSKSIFES
ncbi:MAG TPA: type II toxin-antitoxin system HicA family toxin [Ohtaekwangia sp.]|uniref:type II toxin-antitoxin system HicA family toxin n=1 Tax=Ohtaekwangia sp. TaxID=2066019 RepID=UPI002FB2B85E